MFIRLFDIEINLSILTRKQRVLLDLRESRMWAVKSYKYRYGCTIEEALNYIRKVESTK